MKNKLKFGMPLEEIYKLQQGMQQMPEGGQEQANPACQALQQAIPQLPADLKAKAEEALKTGQCEQFIQSLQNQAQTGTPVPEQGTAPMMRKGGRFGMSVQEIQRNKDVAYYALDQILFAQKGVAQTKKKGSKFDEAFLKTYFGGDEYQSPSERLKQQKQFASGEMSDPNESLFQKMFRKNAIKKMERLGYAPNKDEGDGDMLMANAMDKKGEGNKGTKQTQKDEQEPFSISKLTNDPEIQDAIIKELNNLQDMGVDISSLEPKELERAMKRIVEYHENEKIAKGMNKDKEEYTPKDLYVEDNYGITKFMDTGKGYSKSSAMKFEKPALHEQDRRVEREKLAQKIDKGEIDDEEIKKTDKSFLMSLINQIDDKIIDKEDLAITGEISELLVKLGMKIKDDAFHNLTKPKKISLLNKLKQIQADRIKQKQDKEKDPDLKEYVFI